MSTRDTARSSRNPRPVRMATPTRKEVFLTTVSRLTLPIVAVIIAVLAFVLFTAR